MRLLDKYPISHRHFFGHMLETYAVEEESFYNATFDVQARAVMLFLGQSGPDLSSWSTMAITNVTEGFLKEYEDICIKYPEPPPDPLKEIRNLDYSQIEQTYPEGHQRQNIMQSLRDALVKRETNYDMSSKITLSLRDALKDLLEPIIPQISDDEVWNELTQQFWKHEKAPF